jgi:hypothetical protein
MVTSGGQLTWCGMTQRLYHLSQLYSLSQAVSKKIKVKMCIFSPFHIMLNIIMLLHEHVHGIT